MPAEIGPLFHEAICDFGMSVQQRSETQIRRAHAYAKASETTAVRNTCLLCHDPNHLSMMISGGRTAGCTHIRKHVVKRAGYRLCLVPPTPRSTGERRHNP